MAWSWPPLWASYHHALPLESTSEIAESAQMLTKYGTRQTCEFLTMITTCCMRADFLKDDPFPQKTMTF